MGGSVSKVFGRLYTIVKNVSFELGRRAGIFPHLPDPEAAVLGQEFLAIYERCRPYSMTSRERMFALYQSVKYVVENQIPGDLVECGVWRGGSSMLMALTLLSLGSTERKIYLYDTFQGMPEPTALDVPLADGRGEAATKTWQKKDKTNTEFWCVSSLEEVRANLEGIGYPGHQFCFVEGKVEETIPLVAPTEIALLRLDTDWYESTRHELLHLYPRLRRLGVLIIDDYGCWAGSKKAIDEYCAAKSLSLLLHRIDYTGRVAIKTEP